MAPLCAKRWLFLCGQLLQRLLDPVAQPVALLAQLRRLGPHRRELVTQALDLVLQLFDPRVWTYPSARRLGVRKLQLQPLDGDLELTPLGEKVLDERIRRPGRLFRHSGTDRAGIHAGGGAPSRRAGNGPSARGLGCPWPSRTET